MRVTDLYSQFKALDAQERRELAAAVMAHGGEYVFLDVEDEDVDIDEIDLPIIMGSRKHSDMNEDYYVTRVTANQYGPTIYGFPKEYGDPSDERPIDDIEFSHISFITGMIPETEDVKDVSERYAVYVAFSEEAADAVHNADEDALSDILEGDKEHDLFKIRTFATKAEMNAYIQGLDDLDGWNEYATLDPDSSFDKPLIEIIKRHYED